MKLTPKQYAEVLVNVVSKAPALAERFSESFWLMLKENRQEKLLGAIMRAAQVIWNKKHNLVDVEATVASAMSADEQSALCERLSRALGKTVQLKTRIDPRIKGGIILQIDDNRYDASVSGKLTRLARFQRLNVLPYLSLYTFLTHISCKRHHKKPRRHIQGSALPQTPSIPIGSRSW